MIRKPRASSVQSNESAYSKKLKDPRWQKKRLQILERDNWKCRHCYDAESTLHVHHLLYAPNAEPWDYDPMFLLTLCETCHQSETDNRRYRDSVLTGLLAVAGISADEVRIMNKCLVRIYESVRTVDERPAMEGFTFGADPRNWIIESLIRLMHETEKAFGAVPTEYLESKWDCDCRLGDYDYDEDNQ
jgi:hypothetical protein